MTSYALMTHSNSVMMTKSMSLADYLAMHIIVIHTHECYQMLIEAALIAISLHFCFHSQTHSSSLTLSVYLQNSVMLQSQIITSQGIAAVKEKVNK